MADDPKVISEKDVEGVKKYDDANKNLNKTLDKTKESLDGVKKSADGTKLSKIELAENAKKLKDEADKLNISLDGIKDRLANASEGAESLGRKIALKLTSSMSKYAEIAGVAGSKTIQSLVIPTNEAGAAVDHLFGKYGKLLAPLKRVETYLRSLYQTQALARQAAILHGDSIDKANEFAGKYAQGLRKSALATGLTAKEIYGMNQTMKDVPGALAPTTRGLEDILGAQVRMIQPSAALATTMKAFGMSAAEAGTFGREAFLSFNQTAEQTIKQMGFIAQASKETNAPMSVAREQIVSASKSLAIFGRGSSVAANMWTTFARTLRESRVPLQNIGQIVSNLTQGLANMSIQNRAFISMMSGLGRGATALGGGLQLELAMRSPRGMQRNLQALTRSLSRFGGGRIITLQQAANDPRLEMQFMIQRQMLRKLTGVSGREQQNRILEVLRKVRQGGMSQLEGSRALKDAFQAGRTIQQKSLTALQRIEQLLRAAIGKRSDAIGAAADRTVAKSLDRVSGAAGQGVLSARDFNNAISRIGAAMRNVPRNIKYTSDSLGPSRFSLGSLAQIFKREAVVPRLNLTTPSQQPSMAATPLLRAIQGNQARRTSQNAMMPILKAIENNVKNDQTSVRRDATLPNNPLSVLTPQAQKEQKNLELVVKIVSNLNDPDLKSSIENVVQNHLVKKINSLAPLGITNNK